MGNELRLIISVLAAAVFAVLFIMNDRVWSKRRITAAIEKASAEGCVADGVFTDTAQRIKYGSIADEMFEKYDEITVKYDYEVDGKKYTKNLQLQRNERGAIRYSPKIIIYYDKNDPSQSWCVEEAHKPQTPTGFTFCYIILVGIVTYALQGLFF